MPMHSTADTSSAPNFLIFIIDIFLLVKSCTHSGQRSRVRGGVGRLPQQGGKLFRIVGTDTTLGRVLTVAQVPQLVVNGILGISDNPIIILLLLNLILLIVGCLMETLSAIMILGPILYPVAAAAGMGLEHFGIMMVVNLAIGFCTPPVGVNLFVAAGLREDVSFMSLVRHALPIIGVLLAVQLVITFCEPLVMTIPRLMG